MNPTHQIQIMIVALIVFGILWPYAVKVRKLSKETKQQLKDKQEELKIRIDHTVRPDYPTKNFNEWQKYLYKELRWPQRLEA